MKKTLKMLAVNLAMLLVLSAVYAQSNPKARIIELGFEASKIETRLSGLKSNLDTVLIEVEKQKKNQGRNHTILREIKIESLLKKAKSLTDEISSLDSKKVVLEKQIVADKKDYVSELNNDIDKLLDSIKKNPSDKSVLSELKKSITERASLSQDLIPTYRDGANSMHVYPGDSPEDLLAKAQILEDYQERLADDLKLITDRLYSVKKQRSAMNEIIHLLEEEDFFTETAFFKSVKRSDAGAGIASKSQPAVSEENTGSPSVTEPEEPSIPDQSAADPDKPADGVTTEPETAFESDPGDLTQPTMESARRELNAGLKPAPEKNEKPPQKTLKAGLDSRIAVLERERTNVSKLIREIDHKIKSLKAESERIKKSGMNQAN